MLFPILNMNIREKFGYTYQIESGYHTFSDSGIFNVYFATEPRFFEKCLNLVNRGFYRLKNDAITPTRLSSYKYQLKGQIALGQENRAGLMLNNARNVLNYNRPLDIASVMSNIDKVTSQNIMDVANEILNDRLMSSLVYKER
mgnify:FL=1